MERKAPALPPVEEIRTLLAERAERPLKEILADAAPIALADLLFHLPVTEREVLLRMLPRELAAEVFNHLDDPVMEDILASIDPEFLGELTPLMEPDDAADLVAMMDPPQAEAVLEKLEPEAREQITHLLGFPEDSAGGLMDPDVVRVRARMRVADAVEHIRQYVERVHLDDFFIIFVVAEDGRLLGSVPAWKMLLARPDQRVAEISETGVISVRADRDQEEISHLVRDHDLVVIPVVDEEDRLIGRITVDDILDVIHEEHHEDLGRLHGTGDEEVRELSVWQTIRSRAPFLLMALTGEMILAVIMARQGGFISAVPALAFFIPLIMSMGGNTGMQSASLVIRGLATGEVKLAHFWRRLGREMLVALGLGVGTALIVFSGGGVITGEFQLGLAVGLATFSLILTATTLGAGIPMALKRLGFDPALATGPFITTMNDILGILVYFGIAFWMVS